MGNFSENEHSEVSSWQPCGRSTYLKKSWRQKSRLSRAKHLSASGQPHSQHWTHLACQTRSRTFSKNRSRIGPSQPAHSSSIPEPVDALSVTSEPASTASRSTVVAGVTVVSPPLDFIQCLTASQPAHLRHCALHTRKSWRITKLHFTVVVLIWHTR